MIILTKLFLIREVGRPAAGVCRVRSSVAELGFSPKNRSSRGSAEGSERSRLTPRGTATN